MHVRCCLSSYYLFQGKRSLKQMNHWTFAASFYKISTRKAFISIDIDANSKEKKYEAT